MYRLKKTKQNKTQEIGQKKKKRKLGKKVAKPQPLMDT